MKRELKRVVEIIKNGIAKFIYLLENFPGQKLSASEFMQLYTHIFDMCFKNKQEYEQEIYNLYRQIIEEYVKETVLPCLREKHGEILLSELVKRWKNYKVLVGWMSRLFHYLERYLIPRRQLKSLDEVGFTCFRNAVFQDINIKARDIVIYMIEQERQGAQIDRVLLKNIVDYFFEVGGKEGQGLNYYQKHYEEVIINNTASYYLGKALSWISEEDYYIEKAKECLAKEEGNVSHYVHSCSKYKLLITVRQQFLSAYEKHQLDKAKVDHHEPENLALLRFNALWEAYYRYNSLLVFSTGLSRSSYKELRKKKPLLTPDITVMSVGTEIAYGDQMVPDDGWVQYLNQKWDRNIVTEETAKFPQLKFQAESEQRPHKVSFFVGKDEAQEVIKALPERLENRGLDVKIIYSGGEALDVLPQGAGKGQALAYLLKNLTSDCKQPLNTLVCGDSGNDAELFSVSEVYGIMVSNAQEELLQWHAENAINNPKIIHASERCASGIIQAIGHFKLGLDKSPRDVMDISDDKIETIHPSHEVVKFHMFYERWRRAEVENSEHYIQNLKEFSHPSGIFVHPSGVERPLHDCIDAMRMCYGDKQGSYFRIWVDRISAAQVGSDAWLVKFDKWESSEERPNCCLVTALLSSKDTVPRGFTWVHIHQTWLTPYRVEDERFWLF